MNEHDHQESLNVTYYKGKKIGRIYTLLLISRHSS